MLSSEALESSVRGIRLSYFNKFIDECGGKSQLIDRTTAEVCDIYVKSFTEGSRLSLCEQLSLSGHDFVGTATWFVSHAWQYKFLDVVESIYIFFKKEKFKEKYEDIIVWFDLFSLCQHMNDRCAIPFEFLESTFTQSIKAIGNVLMIMLPWDDPITITRAWCVFEIFACQATESKFEVSMTVAEASRFVAMLTESRDCFYKMLSRVNSQKSEASKPEDRARIFSSIEKLIKGGFTELDSVVLRILEDWMIAALNECIAIESTDPSRVLDLKLSLAGLYERQGKYGLSQQTYERLIGCFQAEDREDSRLLECMDSLGELHLKLGQYDRALELLLTNYERRKSLNGEDDVATIHSGTILAEVYKMKGTYDLSEQLLTKSIDFWKEKSDNTALLASKENLGELYHIIGRYDEAEQLYSDVLSSRTAAQDGSSHPLTLVTANNLASLHKKRAEYTKSINLFSETLETSKRLRGVNHPDTLITMDNLAGAYFKRGTAADILQAETLYRDAYERSMTYLGGKDKRFALIGCNLAGFLSSSSDHASAKRIYEECIETATAVFGGVNPETNKIRGEYANFLSNTGDRAQAEVLLDDCYTQYTASLLFGEDHPDVLSITKYQGALYKAAGRYDLAKVTYQKRYDVSRIKYGDTSKEAVLAANDLGTIYRKLGMTQEVTETFTWIADVYDKVFSDDDLDKWCLLKNCGVYLTDASILTRCYEASVSKLGAHDPATIDLAKQLAGMYRRERRYDLAEPYLSAVYAAAVHVYGADHPTTLDSCYRLGKNLYNQRSFDMAHTHFQTCLSAIKTAPSSVPLDLEGELVDVLANSECYDDAEYLYTRLLNYATDTDVKIGLMQALASLSFSRGDIETGASRCNAALQLSIAVYGPDSLPAIRCEYYKAKMFITVEYDIPACKASISRCLELLALLNFSQSDVEVDELHAYGQRLLGRIAQTH